jgi:hypothetical protein
MIRGARTVAGDTVEVFCSALKKLYYITENEKRFKDCSYMRYSMWNTKSSPLWDDINF